MSSLNKFSESDKVSKKIQQSRLEIEFLKAEYEKTLQQGLNLNKSSIPLKTNAIDELSLNINNSKRIPHTFQEESNHNTHPIALNKDPSDKYSRNINSTRGQLSVKRLETKTDSKHKKSPETKTSVNRARVRCRLNDQLDKEKSPTKCRSYDIEAAREFMKKQNKKRLELKQQSKKVDNTTEIRKQKLDELHKKSQQLLVKNSRASHSRSRSREGLHENYLKNSDKLAYKSEINLKSLSDSKHSLKVPEQSSRFIKVVNKEKTDTKTKLPCNNDKNPSLQLLTPDVNIENKKVKILKEVNAAVVIQSYYRGYKQRKIYKKIKTLKSKENLRPIDAYNKQHPLWFELDVISYPNNFISSVKHKLNKAVKSPMKTVDAAVQITPNENDSPKTSQELKELIERSLNTSKIETVSNKPHPKSKINSVASNNQNNTKKVALKSFLYENCTDLNLKNVASLKLRSKLSDQSDSDTSKNIPDLTTESVSEQRNISTSSSIKDISKNLKLSAKKSSESIQSLNILSNKIMNENFTTKSDCNQFLKVPSYNENIPTELSFLKVSRSSNILKEPSNTDYYKRKVQNNDDYKLSIDVENIKKLKLQRQNEINNFVGKSRSPRDSIISSNQSSYSSYFSSKNGDKSDSSIKSNIPEPKSSEIKTETKNDSPSEIKINSFDKNVIESVNVDSRSSLKSISEILPRTSASFVTLRTTTPQSSTQDSIAKMKNTCSIPFEEEAFPPTLTAPSVSLQRNAVEGKNNDGASRETRNISINVQENPNKIHLKFEAEVHLLNDFNESLRQYVEVERSLLHLEKKKTPQPTYENRDTQTSFKSKSRSITKDDSISVNIITGDNIEHPSLNYSRGSEFHGSNSFDELNQIISRIGRNSSATKEKLIEDESIIRLTSTNASEFHNQSVESTKNDSFDFFNGMSANKENFQNVQTAISLGMFEQLMKDEDVRIENLKTVLKIREKALLDRTKGELAWLEIQRKQFLQTGKVQQASMVKKRQRGLIIKLEHEKYEMQKLKEMQKAASKQRKTKLKERQDLIKVQLSANSVNTKLKRPSLKERKSNGPLKVYSYHMKSMQAEMNLSHRSSITEEVIYSSHTESIISRQEKDLTEAESTKNEAINKVVSTNNHISSYQTEIAKQSLLIREATLQKRKKDVEELLQWHQQLLEEEKKIDELEMAASNIIQQMPHVNIENKCNKTVFKGSQLNLLLENMTGCSDKKFNDDEIYNLSQISLERLCQEGNSANRKSNSLQQLESSRSSQYAESHESEGHNNKTDTLNTIDTQSGIKTINDEGLKQQSIYTSDFEEINSQNLGEGIKKSESTLSEIIQNISSITDGISELYKLSSIQNNVEINSDTDIKDSTNNSQNGEIQEVINSLNNLNKQPVLVKETDSSIINDQKSNISEPLKDNLNVNKDDEEHLTPLEKSNKTKVINDILENSLTESVNLKPSEKNKIIIISNQLLSSGKTKTDKPVNKQLSPSQDTEVTNVLTVNKVFSDNHQSLSSNLKVDTSENLTSIDIINQESTENDIPSLPNESIIESEILNELIENSTKNENLLQSEPATKQIDTSIENEIKTESSEASIKSDFDLTSVEQRDTSSVQSESKESSEASISSEVAKEISFIEDYDSALISVSKESVNSEINIKDLESSFIEKSDISTESELKDVSKGSSEANNIISEVIKEDVALPSSEKSDIFSENGIKSASVESEFSKGIDLPSTDLIENEIQSVINELPEASIKSNVTEEHVDLPSSEHTDISIEVKSVYTESSEPSIKSEIEITNRTSDFSNINVEAKTESIESENQELNNEKYNSVEYLSNDNKQPETSIKDSGSANSSIISENSDSEISSIKVIDIKFDKKSEENKSSESIKDITPETPISQVDVKKRVSEILADVQSNSSVSDKSPRLQDLYVTTYDVNSSENSSPDSGSPVDDKDSWNSSNFYDHEAEELLRKQLAIEQEIKQLEQQQKEQIPYLFIREIPNKPPPPYKPPVQPQDELSIIAVSSEQIESFIPIITNILYKARLENNLKNIEVCEVNGINNDDRACFEFIFHNCQDIAIKHYDQFEELAEISWLKVNKSMKFKKPLKKDGLEKLFASQLKQLFGFEKVTLKESAISRKKRDHVDEVLVIESKVEEPNWTDYDQDELMVKDQVTNEILTLLMNDTIKVFQEIFCKS